MNILMPLPLAYDGNDERYLARDAARHCRYLCAGGHRAVKLLIDDRRGVPPPTSPLLAVAPWAAWCDAAYWRDQSADFVMLYGGMSRRIAPVARAIRAAGVPLGLKMDTGLGILAFPKACHRLLRNGYHQARQRHGPARAMLISLLREASRATGRHHRFLRDYLALFDWITVETPYAQANTIHWFRRQGLDALASRVVFLPHPVPDHFRYDSTSPKRQRLLAVARNWENPLKRGAMLGRVLARVLAAPSPWEAWIVGGNSGTVARAAARAGLTQAARLRAMPIQPSDETFRLYLEAQVLIMPSGAEGSPNVVTEALCCGCSVVYPPELPHLGFADALGGGRMADAYGERGLAGAVVQELAAWAQGQRDAAGIARAAGGMYHTEPVTERLLELFRSTLPRRSAAAAG